MTRSYVNVNWYVILSEHATSRPPCINNFNYTSAASRRARIIMIIRALEGRNVWNTYGGMT
jgi:hypothetical protein